MKTLEQLKSHKSKTLDGRDLHRLMDFIPEAELPHFGITLKPEWVGKHEHKELTRENVLAQLKNDLAFGFEKALNQRGLSAGMMHEVVKMWMWVLDDDEITAEWADDNYAQYGLPLFKRVAVKYGLPNEIGDDDGDEFKYSDAA